MGHYKQSVCVDLRSWLLNVSDQEQHKVVAEWSEHIAECVHCRGALMIIATSLLDQPNKQVHTISCGECQSKLAAYVDTLEEEGYQAAAQHFPEVWWHLWTCAECAETLQGMTALAQAEMRGELMALDRTPSPSMQKVATNPLYAVTLEIPRALFVHTFRPQPQLGRARGGDGEEHTLADDAIRSYSLRVTVSDVQETTCCLIVNSEPPADGRVVLRIGDVVLHADFDPLGEARVPTFPLHLLHGVDGPDLVISLED